MLFNSTNIKEIIVAVVSNPGFFALNQSPEIKIKQVHDLMQNLNDVINK